MRIRKSQCGYFCNQFQFFQPLIYDLLRTDGEFYSHQDLRQSTEIPSSQIKPNQKERNSTMAISSKQISPQQCLCKQIFSTIVVIMVHVSNSDCVKCLFHVSNYFQPLTYCSKQISSQQCLFQVDKSFLQQILFQVSKSFKFSRPPPWLAGAFFYRLAPQIPKSSIWA